MEVSYFPEGGSITDYTCTMFGTCIGVSVTRAMKFKGDFEAEDAKRLLNKKLNGTNYNTFPFINIITGCCGSIDQVLHRWRACFVVR